MNGDKYGLKRESGSSGMNSCFGSRQVPKDGRIGNTRPNKQARGKTGGSGMKSSY